MHAINIANQMDKQTPLLSEKVYAYPDEWPTNSVHVTCKHCEKNGDTVVHMRSLCRRGIDVVVLSCIFVGVPLLLSWIFSSYKFFLDQLLYQCIFITCFHLSVIGCRCRRPEHQCKHCKTLLNQAEIDSANRCPGHGGGNDGGYDGGFDAGGDCGGGDGGGGD